MVQRLNAEIRNAILTGMLDKKFMAENDAVLKLEQEAKAASIEASKFIYEAVYDQKTRDKLAAAPKGEYSCTNSFRVRFEGGDNGNYEEQVITEEYYRILAKHSSHFTDDSGNRQWPAFFVIDDPESQYVKLSTAAKAKAQEAKDAAKARGERWYALKQRITNVLNSVTTIKRLLEVWPECKEYVPEVNSGPSGGVPAEMIADLNKEIGLS